MPHKVVIISVMQRKDFLKLENIQWHGVQINEPDWESADRYLSCLLFAVSLFLLLVFELYAFVFTQLIHCCKPFL